jgi:hypothetical protein
VADTSVIRITAVYDAGPIISGNQQAAAATEQSAQSIQASLIKAGLAYKQYMSDVRAQTAQVAELNAALGKSAESGSATAAEAIRDAEVALDSYIDKAAAAKVQILELTAAFRAQGAAAETTAKAPTASAEASASSFESLATTGTVATGAGASAAGYEAMIAAEGQAAAAGTALNEVQEAQVLANEQVTASALLSSEAWAREAGIEGAATATAERSTVMGRLLASVKQSIASALGIETAAVTSETVATNASAEAAEKSASAWSAYAGVTEETAAAVTGEAEAETVRTAATTAGIGANRAATAEFRILEGGLAGSTRGAAAFLTNTLKLGPALQAAFPIFGAVAFGAILYEIGKGITNLFENTVLLKGAIEAIGDASARSAKASAEANWKYVESYVELLKAQGKYAEALEFEQAHAGEKVETISLGIDKKKLKDFPQDFQDFANSLEHVNTTGKEGAAAFAAVDAQIAKITQDLATATAAAESAGRAFDAAAEQPGAGGSSANAGQLLALSLEKEHADKQVELTKTMLDTLQNLHNKHVSDVAAEYNKGAAEVVTLTEKEFHDIDTIAKADAENTKKMAEAKAAYQEELAKHQLAIGQTTADQEVAAVEAANKKKLEAEINYLQARNFSLTQDPEYSKDSGAQAQVINNEGQIAALKQEMRTKDLAAEDAVTKAKLQIQLDAINEQIEALKAVPAATVQQEKEIDAQIVQLRRQAMADVAGASFGAGSEQYKSTLKEFEDANRALSEAIKKADDEATQHRLDNLDRLLSAQENEAEQQAKVAQAQLQNDIKGQQDALAQRQAQQIKPEGGITGAVFDQSKLGGDTAAAQNIAEEAADEQEKIQQTLTQQKIALLQQEQAARNADLAAGTLSAQKYSEESMKIQQQITKDVQDNAAKQEEIKLKEAADLERIAQQEAQKEMQIQNQIANSLARETDKMIFQTKNLHDAMTKLWTDAVKFIIEQMVKMASQFVVHTLMMLVAKRAADQAMTQGVIQNDVEQTASATTAAKTQGLAWVGVAGAAGVASWAAAPWPIDAGAPAFGAAMAGTAAGFVVAEAGWDMPEGGPFPMFGHAKEMMLPRPLAEGFRGIINDQSSRVSNDSNTENSNSAEAFHYHAGPVHALDSTGVDAVLSRQADRFSRAMSRGVKTGKIDPRTFAPRVRG